MRTIQPIQKSTQPALNAKQRMASAVLSLAIPVLALTAFPLTSDAGHENARSSNRRVVGQCGSCHQDIYANYQAVSRDRCGHLNYSWVNQPHTCRHASHHRGHVSHRYQGHHRGSSHGYSIFDFIRHLR